MRISDGRGASATATVSVTITAVNDARKIGDAGARRGSAVDDADRDGSRRRDLQLTLVTPPAHPEPCLSIPRPRAGSRTRRAGAGGGRAIHCTDALSTTTTAVAITVRAVNDAPVTTADTATTTQQSTVVADVLANHSDVDDATLTLSIVHRHRMELPQLRRAHRVFVGNVPRRNLADLPGPRRSGCRRRTERSTLRSGRSHSDHVYSNRCRRRAVLQRWHSVLPVARPVASGSTRCSS